MFGLLKNNRKMTIEWLVLRLNQLDVLIEDVLNHSVLLRVNYGCLYQICQEI